MGKKNKDHNAKKFSLSEAMMGDLLFVLKPLKEKEMEAQFWAARLQFIKNDIVKSRGIDPAKWNCDWVKAFQTGVLECTKLPEPKIVKEADKNGKTEEKK